MHAINPNTEFRDDETGCTPHWSRSNSGREPKSFVYPAQLKPERREVASRPAGYWPSAVEQLAGKAAEKPGVTPSQWLRQWCCLDEQT